MCRPSVIMGRCLVCVWTVVVLCCSVSAIERKSPVGHQLAGNTPNAFGRMDMHGQRRQPMLNGSAVVALDDGAIVGGVVGARNMAPKAPRRLCRVDGNDVPCRRRLKRTTRGTGWPAMPTRATRGVDRTNLCDTQECRCSGRQLDLTVQCNYTKPYLILRDDLYIDTTYKILILHLSPKTTLTVHKGFFHNNQVQRFQVLGGQQFELASNAMDGNANARFPQIEFLGCAKVIFGSFAFHKEFKLNVTDVPTVYVFPEAFSGTRFQATFLRVADLRIQAKAFAGAVAGSHLHVIESRLDELAPLQASLREAKFERTRIGVIEALAFDVTEVNSIEFGRCEIGVVRATAFTEKLYSRKVSFLDSTISTFESNAISKSGINDLILKNNNINRINQNAIASTTVNALVINNTILHAEELWLSVSDWQNITVAQNIFGKFGRMDLKTSNPVECSFRHNLIAESLNDCLHFGYGHCAVKNTTFNQYCLCGQSWPRRMFRNGPKDGQLEEVNCLVDETVQTCYNTTHMRANEYQANICSQTKRYVDCVNDRRTKMDISGFPDLNAHKSYAFDLKQIAIIAGATVLLIVLLSAVVAVCRRIRRSSDNGDRARPTTCSETILTESDSSSNVSYPRTALIMKPSKAFSVDDRVIIRQTLHQMKGRYRAELYDQVYNNTMKVLNNELNEPEQVAAIGEIIEALHECQQSGGDFVAFTAILYRQLEPQEEGGGGQITLDPVYAEPGVTMGDMDEHVYAEPRNLQQCPLLTNEYASPLDRDTADNYPEYAEPHRGNDTARRIISPYAIAATKPSAPTLPGHEPHANLPDVLASHSTNRRPLPHQPPPPLYALPMHKQPTPGPSNAASSTSARYARRAKERTPPDDAQTHSDHSGGSDVTCRMDDIDYADS